MKRLDISHLTNARLMALAPELLAALEKVQELIEEYVYEDVDEGPNDAAKATRLIDEVLAKAEKK